MAILVLVWFFPQQPRWIVDSGDGSDLALGFTDRGEVLTVCNTVRTIGRTRTRQNTYSIRDLMTGKELRSLSIPPEYGSAGVLIPDGKNLVLMSDPESQAIKLASLNLNDGSTTHQLDECTLSEFRSFSPNGRYWTITNAEGDNFIYDSVLKKNLFPTRKPLFCSDNQRLIMEDSSGDHVAFQFYSLSTGQQLGRVELPYPWQTILKYRSWEGDRVEFWIRDPDSRRLTLYSCDVSDYELNDLRQEPDWKGAVIPEDGNACLYLRGDHWSGVWRPQPTSNYLHGLWNRTAQKLGLASLMVSPPRPVFTWQSLNPNTGEPIHHPIPIASYTGCELSPDGRTLLAYDGQLKCWDVDPPSRFPLAIIAVVGIWIALWRSRWLIRPLEMA